MDHAYGRSTLLHRLDAHARTTPLKPFVALYHGEQFQVLTYAGLQAGAEDWAQRFAAISPRPGAPVFLILRHGLDLYAGFLGAMLAGLVPAFLPPPSPKQEPGAFWAAQRAVFARSQPGVVVVGRADLAALTQEGGPIGCPFLVAEDRHDHGDLAALADPDPAEAALLQHSSGTTGLKKAVRLSFQQVDRHAGMVAEALRLRPDDIVASWLPLYHDMGLLAAFLIPLTLGASVVALDPFAWVADPASLLRAIDRHRATLCWMPNFAFGHLLRAQVGGARHDLSSLRALIDCSEPCRPETLEAFTDAFADHGLDPNAIACSYGMAEAVFAVTQTPRGVRPAVLEVDAHALESQGVIAPAQDGRTHRFVSCGRPLPGVDLRIASSPIAAPPTPEDGRPRIGEIELSSPVLFDGYHHGEATPIDPPIDGWRRTGDIGFVHQGELYVCGRTMERLIVHGRTVYAGDLEAAASEVAGVKAGRVVALSVMDEASSAEEAWLMLEADQPLADPAAREALMKAVRRAVQDALDVTLRGVEIGPPGWLAKSTSGKMSRADNLQKLNRLLAQRPKEAPSYGPPRPEHPIEPAARRNLEPTPKPRFDTPARVDAPPRIAARSAVLQALAECFGRPGARLVDGEGLGDVAGWDSLGHTILILRIEALTGVAAPEAVAARAHTVGALVDAFTTLAGSTPEAVPLQRDAA